MFEAEQEGLQALAQAATLRVPKPLCSGVIEDQSYLIMEYVHLNSRASAVSEEEAGRQLALLHRHTAARYGWHRDNTIGATRQPNTEHSDWCSFWRDERLGFQLQEARRNGCSAMIQELGSELQHCLDRFLDHNPEPSLLHGDLWGGNLAYNEQGHPVVYDPATYYGDRETDLAMTELFGGFSQRFYAAYHKTWPLPAGYSQRKTLYNLYHILNHMNMFGGGYQAQAINMMQQLLA